MFKSIKQFTFELTAKGVLKPAQSKAAKQECVARLTEAGFVATPSGAMVVQIGVDANGSPVYFKVEPTVTKADVFAEKKPRSTAKKATAVDAEPVPSLFGE